MKFPWLPRKRRNPCRFQLHGREACQQGSRFQMTKRETHEFKAQTHVEFITQTHVNICGSWMFQANIGTVRVNACSIARKSRAIHNGLVLPQRRLQPPTVNIVDVACCTNLALRHWRAQIATTFLCHLLLTGPDNIVIIKDGKPQRRSQITDELVNTLNVGFGDEVSGSLESPGSARQCAAEYAPGE